MLSAKQFGLRLIETKDLDPVYCAIYGAKLPERVRNRLLLAYWCLYHLGAAAKIAESRNFYETLYVAAKNAHLQWPRGSERRHWRGANALKSWEAIHARFKRPEQAVPFFAGEFGKRDFSSVSKRVRTIAGFGPWMAFKVADMLERVCYYPIDFSNCELGIYEEPRKGAALYLRALDSKQVDNEIVRLAVERLRRQLQGDFGNPYAPPCYTRPINVQEVETVLCKWKAHVNGHYEVGKDIKELRHALSGWGDLADELLKHAPKEVE